MVKKYKMTPQEAWAEWERKRDEIDYRTDLVLKELWRPSHAEFEKELKSSIEKRQEIARQKKEKKEKEKIKHNRKWKIISIIAWILLVIIIL